MAKKYKNRIQKKITKQKQLDKKNKLTKQNRKQNI